MAEIEVRLPKMGESVTEATITNWLKNIGDKVAIDEPLVEVATDKVDNELPSEASGILSKRFFEKDQVAQVGDVIAILSSDEISTTKEVSPESIEPVKEIEAIEEKNSPIVEFTAPPTISEIVAINSNSSGKFFSPLVRSIAKKENISQTELESIQGSGQDARVTKNDLLSYIANRGTSVISNNSTPTLTSSSNIGGHFLTNIKEPIVLPNPGDELIEMDRMRKLISGYMVASVQTSAHVQSFIEVDVTNIVKWRDKVKAAFEKREGEKLTFTPIFMEAVAKALKDFPGMNISVDGEYIIKKKNINLGMAAALPNGNLIVPVIKNADQLNLVGMAKAVNDLGNRAKEGKLKPDDTQGGTYTVTNVGTFGSVFGTPIINQPQVGILALGAIRKVPAVIETPEGDFIGIRNKMFLSHSYDHRVVDGALGGSFVKRVADYLEAFDINREF